MSANSDFSAWVSSMETTWGESWHTIEVYRYTRTQLKDGTHVILTAIDGRISTIQHYNADGECAFLQSIGEDMGIADLTWGMGLHEMGYRKIETYWANSMTGERANFNAPEFFRAINAGNMGEAYAWVMLCEEPSIY